LDVGFAGLVRDVLVGLAALPFGVVRGGGGGGGGCGGGAGEGAEGGEAEVEAEGWHFRSVKWELEGI